MYLSCLQELEADGEGAPRGSATRIRHDLTARERQAAVRGRSAVRCFPQNPALTPCSAWQEERSRLELHPQTSITLDHARLSVRYSEGITWVLTADLELADASLTEHLAAAVQVGGNCPRLVSVWSSLSRESGVTAPSSVAGILVRGEGEPSGIAARLRPETRRLCCCREEHRYPHGAAGPGTTGCRIQVSVGRSPLL